MRHLFIILFLFISSLSFGQYQSSKNKKANKYFKKGKQEVALRDFDEGIRLFKKAISKDSTFVGAYMQLGNIYRVYAKQKELVAVYEKVLKLENENTLYFQIYYDLAVHYLRKGNYEKASSLASKYLDSKSRDKTKRKDCEAILANAAFALKSIASPKNIAPVKLEYPLNEFDLQYFPSLNVDGSQIYFTMRGGSDPDNKEDIYTSIKKQNGTWSEPKTVSTKINKKNSNEGTCAVSADGNTLIFTSCAQGKDNLGSCDLFISYKEKGKWSKPENLGENVNTSRWESQPSLSFDGRVLYFVSDRIGGYGGRDIYMSSRSEEGIWSKSINLGKTINTNKDDIGPFLHPSGDRLIMASNGRLGMGGFDLYYSLRTGENGIWEEPFHFGYPINNHLDQISLVILADNSKAYYSEDEKHENSYYSYMYSFDLPEEFKPKNRENYMIGKVYDTKSKMPIKAKLRLMNLKTDSLITQTYSNSIDGKYSILMKEGNEYALFVSSPGYLFKSIHIKDIRAIGTGGMDKDFSLDPVKTNVKVQLENIFFESAKFKLKEKSKTELKEVANFMVANPTFKVEISGHTDNVGKENYNFELSMKRAKSVVDYLVTQGVDAKNLRFVGHGETKHIDSNDTVKGRKNNRRIEFSILSY